MEVTAARPVNEAAQLAAASLQNVRFKERRLRDADSLIRNEAIFFSPVIRIDHETSTAIIQYRDRDTGEVKREYPEQSKYRVYEAASDTEMEIVFVDPSAEPEKAPVEHIDENI